MKRTIQAALRDQAEPSTIPILQRFFKTGPGEYAEGDTFIGVRVPATRRVAESYRKVPLAVVVALLQSPVHEERLLALIIMTHQFRTGTPAEQSTLYRTYLNNTAFINNWDLVDTSAEHLVGAYLKNRSRQPLHRLARSASLWERRIAIMSTFHFIKQGDFDETLALAEKLLADKHDLIHKAVGWMLREVGNRDRKTEEAFLAQHYRQMPRTMLRYAIEKFSEATRQQYLKGAANKIPCYKG